MDEAINFLNVEIGVFLRYLRCFSKIENVQINQQTMELMQEAILNMKQLSLNAQIIENSMKNDVDFLFELDEHQYELQRHILCRTCFEMFPLSKHEFTAHLKRKHYEPNSTGSNSFSSDYFPETESTYQVIGYSKASTNMSDSGQRMSDIFSDHGFVAEDSNLAENTNGSAGQLRYSDIVRKVAPTPDPDENVINIKPIDMLMTLGDLIRTDRCFDAISLQMTDFTTRTDHRMQIHANILQILTNAVNSFDPALNVSPFGSVEYTFSGVNTNYNIFIDTRKSEKSPALLLRTFQKYFMSSEAQQHFDLPVKISSNRVIKQQLRTVHKESHIECHILFDNDANATKSAKIINDFINLKPICRQLIAYVRAWQNVVNSLAVQNGDIAFQFNTYIIAVLVIFFLQVNYDLPPVADVSSLVPSDKERTKSVYEEQKDFGRILFEFFYFYGSRYEINNHLISARIGRWQEQRLTGQQKNFTPEQKRLRDSMAAIPENWQKCTMFVQDLLSLGVNITAEISKEEAYNFQGMCQMFSILQKHSPPKRIPKAVPQLPMRRATSCGSLASFKTGSVRAKPVKDEKLKVSTASTVKKTATKKATTKSPSTTLDEAIKSGKIYELITAEMDKFASRSQVRIRHEVRILGMLKQEFKIFDHTLELIPIGSTTYGFACNDSMNYNILVDTRKSQQVQGLVLESFEKYLATTDIQLHFDGIAEVPASRTLKQQLRMIHKESGIRVLLLADDISVAEASKIIRDFITIKPICRNLIECILAWKNALNTILAQAGASVFQFNTYMICVLVIFFMQVNYDAPIAQDVHSIRSNSTAISNADASFRKDLTVFDKILADFFWFYGQRYQIWNHVISLSIGRWQERRIQDQQKFFLPNQKRLRDGISANQANWKNCTMYVEDVVRSGVNIAAEITTKDAYGFQEMCQTFAKKNICQKICRKEEDL